MRIVSFLPSATEMVCALGLREHLVGITHECDYPPEIAGVPVVVQSAISYDGMSQQEIDDAVAQRLRSGESLYHIDEHLLRSLKPDLILTQDLCQVCAPSGNEVSHVLNTLPHTPQILWMTPQSLAGIDQNIRDLGNATGTAEHAEALIEANHRRWDNISKRTKHVTPRRVFCMEWLEPVFTSGHWIPEMVKIAGGVDSLGREGKDSIRISWEDVLRWAPEVLVIMPCGFNLEKVVALVPQLFLNEGWDTLPAVRSGNIFAVDANAFFARPGPRMAEGTALLAHLIHPEIFSWNGAHNAYRRIESPRRSVASPCIDICTLDATGTFCTGCNRTLHEIASWSGFSDAEKLRIIASLHESRKPSPAE